MALTDFFSSPSKPTAAAAAAAAESQLETPSSTPPPSTGISTPRPDPTDRRFPSILSGYFSQVCSSPLLTTASLVANYGHSRTHIDSGRAPAEPAMQSSTTTLAPRAACLQDDRSPSPADHDFDDHPAPLLPHEQLTTSSATSAAAATAHQHGYPTPPLSSSSSIKQEHGASSSALASRRSSALETTPISFRKATYATALAETTRSSVHSADIQNPVAFPPPHGPPDDHTFASHALSALALSDPCICAQMLTEDAPQQQTPPRTPRTLSNESKPSNTSSSDGPTSQPAQMQDNGKPRKTSPADGAIVGEAKGKLSVLISEGRGLRPSADPYLVCQFQYNEYISKGPRTDGASSGDVDARVDGFRKGLPIQRTDSNPGRPMAIPMKSRQSSQTSMSSRDTSRARKVTDPVWNHECTL